ncbi:MAG: hypothetical protein WAL34_04230 [Acidobacteriaceae bacterium]
MTTMHKAIDALAKLAPQDNEPPQTSEQTEAFIKWRDDVHLIVGALLVARGSIGDVGVEGAVNAWKRMTDAYSPRALRERDGLREQLAIAQKTVLAYQNHTGQTLDDTLGGKWTNSVPKLQADNAKLRRAIELILPLAKGYSPQGQTPEARRTCNSWVEFAEDALAEPDDGEHG